MPRAAGPAFANSSEIGSTPGEMIVALAGWIHLGHGVEASGGLAPHQLGIRVGRRDQCGRASGGPVEDREHALRHGRCALGAQRQVSRDQVVGIAAGPRAHPAARRAGQRLHARAGDGQVWTYNGQRRGIVRLDPRTGRRLHAVPIAAESVDALAVGAGAVWVTDTWGGLV
jgi:hypothetical protein